MQITQFNLAIISAALAFLSSVFAQSAAAPPPSIVCWWSGDSNTLDRIGGYTGSLIGGATYTDGKVKTAFSFNGTTAGVVVSNSPSLNIAAGMDFTLEAWIKAGPMYTKEILSIVDKRESTNIYSAVGYALSLDNGYLCLQLASGNFQNYWAFPNLRDSQWHHVAATVKRSQADGGRLYVDGYQILAFDARGFSGSLSNGAPLKIGCHADPNYDGTFYGAIDEVSLYHTALSSSEVASIYQAGSAGKLPVSVAPANLTGWWPANNNANDSAGTNSGVLVGGATFAVGKVGPAFSFNGTSSGIIISNAPELNFGTNEDLTIETWIKAEPDFSKEILNIVDKRVTPNIFTATGYSLCLDYGFLCFQLANGPAQNYWAFPDLRDSRWHHVAVSVNRDSVTGGKLYVDGGVILTFDPTPFTGSLSNGAPLKIGIHADPNYNGYFSGLIDELSIYRRALTDQEIFNIYKADSAGKMRYSVFPQDGISDSWRIAYFGADSVDAPRAAANADPDLDGVNNYEEFLAGTNPIDKNSYPTNVNPLLVFNPAAGDFTNEVSVTLSTPVYQGVIFYTMDALGSTNLSSVSRFYHGPLQTNLSCRIRAFVSVNGYVVSPVYSNIYLRVYYTEDDGIPSEWRELYFGPAYRYDPRALGASDPDQDGADNLAEFHSGTNPLDPKSVLQITNLRFVPVLTWNSVSNKTYRVMRRDEFNTNVWINLAPPVYATGSQSSFTDYSATNRNGFYRVVPVVP